MMRITYKFGIITLLFMIIFSINTRAASYKKAYKKILNKCYKEWVGKSYYIGDDKCYFLVKNIDKKGKPELLIEAPMAVSGSTRGNHFLYVYTIKNGKAKRCGEVTQSYSGFVQYSNKYKAIEDIGTGTGFYSQTLWGLQNNKMIKVASTAQVGMPVREFKERGITKYYKETGSDWANAYLVNDSYTTKEDFDSAHNQYFEGLEKSKMKRITKKNISKIK